MISALMCEPDTIANAVSFGLPTFNLYYKTCHCYRFYAAL